MLSAPTDMRSVRAFGHQFLQLATKLRREP
jgi:hypothetical protein